MIIVITGTAVAAAAFEKRTSRDGDGSNMPKATCVLLCYFEVYAEYIICICYSSCVLFLCLNMPKARGFLPRRALWYALFV